MKKSERIAHLKDFIVTQAYNGLAQGYPKAVACAETSVMDYEPDAPERIAEYDRLIKETTKNMKKSNFANILKDYMELEEHFTFYLNWTGDLSNGKEMINVPFYEFIETMQNLGHFEDYYVAFKIPKKGKVGRTEKLNIRVDVIKRY